jgi:hypothetical protein
MMTSLADLCWHWEGTYEFACKNGIWSARPVDAPAEIMTADSAEALRTLVRQDHAERYSTRRPGQQSGSAGSSSRMLRGSACPS